jgi:hypothetical protein
LHGFLIDIFPYPNEEGAIPNTGITQSDAQALCGKLDKRLCTELEWERACKGPSQHVYDYGDRYREETCGTGTTVVPRPSGIKVGCQSDFGVRDLHGGVFEWTESRWARGMTNSNKVVIRGGNDIAGELVSRCANAESHAPNAKSANIGLRCCKGPVNEVEVLMRVEHGETISSSAPDPTLVRRMLDNLSAEARAGLTESKWDPIFGYIWRPVDNERLVVQAICARRQVPQRCAVLIGHDTHGIPTVLGAATTGYFPSKLYLGESTSDIWLLGTDATGPFRRLIHYNWGHVDIGAKEGPSSHSERDKLSKKRKKRR